MLADGDSEGTGSWDGEGPGSWDDAVTGSSDGEGTGSWEVEGTGIGRTSTCPGGEPIPSDIGDVTGDSILGRALLEVLGCVMGLSNRNVDIKS